ncbi:MAG: CpsB/CapC family capsule biosynthesis tyrosine phosphatase [Eubacteriaceae bacterium]
MRAITATPHWNRRRGYTENTASILRSLKTARDLAREINPWFQIYLGREVAWEESLPEILPQHPEWTMGNSNYLMVEFEPEDSCERIEQGLLKVSMMGFRPILAHIDRYPAFYKNIEYTRKLKDMGIVIQMNSGAVTSAGSKTLQRFVAHALDECLVDLMSSDTHGINHRRPQLKAGADYIEKKYSRTYADKLYRLTAVRILKNKTI